MARIAGVDLPRNKRIDIGLTYVYGIGNTTATEIVNKANVLPSTRCHDLTDEEITTIRAISSGPITEIESVELVEEDSNV